MQYKYKISTFGKFISVAANIFMIIFVVGKWIALNQIPMIIGSSVQRAYSIFEITDFMDIFSYYLYEDEVGIFAAILTICVVAVMVIGGLKVILTLINAPSVKTMSVVSIVLCSVLAIIFIVSVCYINYEASDITYGGIDHLLKTTANPYLTVAMSVLSLIGVRMQEKNKMSVMNINLQNQIYNCANCGARIDFSSKFCNNCGFQIDKADMLRRANICVSCGAKIKDGDVFCSICGAKVGE